MEMVWLLQMHFMSIIIHPSCTSFNSLSSLSFQLVIKRAKAWLYIVLSDLFREMKLNYYCDLWRIDLWRSLPWFKCYVNAQICLSRSSNLFPDHSTIDHSQIWIAEDKAEVPFLPQANLWWSPLSAASLLLFFSHLNLCSFSTKAISHALNDAHCYAY